MDIFISGGGGLLLLIFNDGEFHHLEDATNVLEPDLSWSLQSVLLGPSLLSSAGHQWWNYQNTRWVNHRMEWSDHWDQLFSVFWNSY